jgi:acetamidase/formamidase
MKFCIYRSDRFHDAFIARKRVWSESPAYPILPASYYRKFSSKIAPVLRIQPGDTVSTESLDAAGNDKHGVSKAERGNPPTGPFYIESAQPGDLLY